MATVENGVVKGVAVGTAIITTTTSNGQEAICEVTVGPKYVTFDKLSTSDWVAPTASGVKGKVASVSEVTVGEDTALQFTATNESENVGQATYTKELGTSEILCFQYQIANNMADGADKHHGFALAQQAQDGYILSATADGGYYFSIRTDKVVLQKRDSENISTNIAETYFNASSVFGKKEDDTQRDFCNIEIGAINYADGSVGIHFKIDKTLIFDPEKTKVDDPLVGGYFGVFVRKAYGSAYLKKAPSLN